MSPYILTPSPTGFASTALADTASPAHDLMLALPTTSSEQHLTAPVPTHASIDLQRDWAFPSGCDLPGASYFSSEFANLKSFPTSLFSGPWDAGASGCTWVDTSSPTSTSTSTIPSPTSNPATPSKSGLSTHAIIGIAVGAGILAILLATWLVFCVMRRRHCCRDAPSDSENARASLLPVAYPIFPRRRDSRGMTRSGVRSPRPSQLNVDTKTERTTVRAGPGEARSLANCSVIPRLSVSSPLPGSVVLGGPPPQEAPCRAEKALMQLRERDWHPQATAREVAPPLTDAGVDTAPETRQPRCDVEAGLYDSGGRVPPALDAQEADHYPGGVVDGFCDIAVDHPPDFDAELDSDSDSDSRNTLPPPYSSNPSLGEQAV